MGFYANIKRRYITFMCILILTGCTSNIPLDTAIPHLVTSPTIVLQTPTSTWVPTVTPTQMSTAQTIKPNELKDILLNPCLVVEPEFPSTSVLPWDILVHGETLTTIDLNDGTKVSVPYFYPRSGGAKDFDPWYYVSPDGKWLAYENTDETRVYFNETKTLSSHPDQNNNFWDFRRRTLLRGWVNNDTVLMIYWRTDTDWFATTLLLNPFTGDRQELTREQFPNYLKVGTGTSVMPTYYYQVGDLSADPTQKRVVYPTQGEGYKYNILWDVEKNRLSGNWRDWAIYGGQAANRR